MAISNSKEATQRTPASAWGQEKPLRFITCGNVDDGKSTLIGRLLWDTNAVKSDHRSDVEASQITLASGEKHPDFANLLDGLQAEREQGITIDVAYRFFSTPKRAFIVADTPGHEQYTRNMVTGASTADVAILLADAQVGVTEQTRRHALIASMMGIKDLVLVVNKMDLVKYDAATFARIRSEFEELTNWIKVDKVTSIPTAAVHGYNVVYRDNNQMTWYNGPTVLESLEGAQLTQANQKGFRLCVQRVSRPNESFRGFQGTVQNGSILKGQEILVQHSNLTAKVEEIHTFDGPIDHANSGDAVTLVLDRKIDISAGDYLVEATEPMQVAHSVQAQLVILDEHGIDPRKRYWLKSQSKKQRVYVTPSKSFNLRSGIWNDETSLSVNTILSASLSFGDAFFFDLFEQSKATGSFILIDPDSFNTIAAGMVVIDETKQNDVDVINGDVVSLQLPAELAAEMLLSAIGKEKLSQVKISQGELGKFDENNLQLLQNSGLKIERL